MITYILIEHRPFLFNKFCTKFENCQDFSPKHPSSALYYSMTVPVIPITQIDPPSPILRRFSEIEVSFLEMVDQIKHFGSPFHPPLARPREEDRYQIVDGYRRYRACLTAGLDEIPLRVMALTDEEYLSAQIICNSQHKETDCIDFAEHLEKLRELHREEMTLGELSYLTQKSTSWIRQVLRLNHLDHQIKVMVKRNEVSVGNAHWLARLPMSEQSKWVEDAQTMPVRQFSKIMKRELNDYREKIRQGRLDACYVDKMRPMMRNMQDIEQEMTSPKTVALLIASENIDNPIDAAQLALKWAFRMDEDSLAERSQKAVKLEEDRIEKTIRRKEIRDKLKKQDCAY